MAKPFHTENYANWYAIVTNLESIRVIVIAMLQKKNGAYIIGTGFVFAAIVTGSSIVLTGMGVLPWSQLQTITTALVGLFGLLLSMSIFLARNFAQTSRELGAKFAEVRELSDKALRQELERVRLEQKLDLEQLQAEKLHEIDRLKSRFFANISHEFRTPLTLLLGPLENLLAADFDEAVKKQFRMMLRNGRRLLRLINQLLDLAKLEAGVMSVKARRENIVQLLKSMVLAFASLAERQKIALEFHAPRNSMIAYVDRDKFEKIITNLLSNAFKFTPEQGAIEVAVDTSKKRRRSPHGAAGTSPVTRFIEITVKDSGTGIAAEKLPHVFDRFYQADDSYTREQEGSGIGLALAKELVELHRGRIEVDSAPGKGTTFTVCLPLGRAHLREEEISQEPATGFSSPEEAALSAVAEPATAPPRNRRGGRSLRESQHRLAAEARKTLPHSLLLIVEDNPDVRSYICEHLKREYRIIEAADGEDGFEKARRVMPDLVISDVMMPKMDGYQLCKKLKTDPLTSHMPVILLTARAGAASKIEGLETGADDYIVKPFQAGELRVRVKNLIVQRRKLRERFRREIFLQPRKIAATSMDEQFLQRAMTAIEQNLADAEFSTARFAHEVAMSRMQLNRKLRALTGHSTRGFIRAYRLKRAAQLLEHRAGTVTEICYDVGFNNLSHFAKIFKEQFGRSPSDYAGGEAL